MVDVLWLAIGLAAGGLGAGAAMEMVGRLRSQGPPPGHMTSTWRLGDLRQPTVVVRDLLEVDAPPGTTVYASGLVDPAIQQSCNVYQVPPVKAEFALEQDGARALLFLAGARPGTSALLSLDPVLLARLQSEARILASRAEPYIERHRVQDLAGRQGVAIETKGLITDVMPYQGQYMARLEDDGHTIGILLAEKGNWAGKRVRVEGRMGRDRTGYPVIEDAILRP